MTNKRTKRAHGEGSYTVRPDGRVQYRVLIDGRRITATGRTRSEAKAKARERAQVLGSRKTAATVRALAEEWTELPAAERGLRPTTADNYASLLTNHVLPSLGDERLEALTQRKVAQAVQGMGGATSTRRSSYAAFVRLLDYAVAQGLLGRNIARDVPRPSRAEAAPRDLTDDEAVRLLQAAQGHRWELAAWLGLACGMRRGEVLGLQWADVDLAGGSAHVRRNVTRSSAGLVVGEPKTRRGRRMVPLPPAVIAQLKAHRKRQSAERLKAGSVWVDSGHVLTNEAGGVVEPRNLSRAWAVWAATAGVEDTGTHVGRHYAATTLLASGQASVADVAAMLGHDPGVLLGTYAAAVAQGQRQAADVLGQTLAAGVRKAK